MGSSSRRRLNQSIHSSAAYSTASKLFADETTAPVLEPGRKRTSIGQIWAYASDDRPWGGSDPPMVAYVYTADRKYCTGASEYSTLSLSRLARTTQSQGCYEFMTTYMRVPDINPLRRLGCQLEALGVAA